MKKKWLIALFSVLFVLTGALGLTSCVGEGAWWTGDTPHVHTYTDVITNPTCEEQGYTTHVCDCGDDYVDSYVVALGHDYSVFVDVSREATCESNRVDTYKCSRCTSTEDKEIANSKFGHDYGEWVSNGEGAHVRQCGRDSTHIEMENCGGGTATCDSLAFCSTCHTEYGDYGHIVAVEAGKAATCLKKGYTDKEYCSACGEVFVESVVIPRHGHILGDWYVYEASTEFEAGEERRDCSECSYYESKEAELVGHEYVLEAIVAPTCANYGYTVYRCSGCTHAYQDDYVAKLPHVETQTTIQATCTTDGYVLHECDNCDYSYITDHVAATGHTFGGWDTIQEADCEVKGNEKCVCQGCGDEKFRDVSATGHHYIVTSVVETWESIETTYECEYCEKDIVVAEGRGYDATKEAQLLDQETDFVFTVVCTQEDPEAYIKENLKIEYEYFEEESGTEVPVLAYALTKSTIVENGWDVFAEEDYEQGLTYVARINAGLVFADYYGKKLTFSIKNNDAQNQE
ncbi:MAG: hypothetical protein IKC37_00790, partial [Clostridia bacterium]|nr:hypothetical protein [Clostridia bacterium]